MKVCFLAGTLGQGGAERQLLYMLQALKSAGIESRVICLTKGEIYQSRIESLDIEVDYVGRKNSRLSRLAEITCNLKNKPADIIQSSHFYTNIYAAIAGKISRARSIGAIRSDLTSEIGGDKIFGRWQVSLPENLIANSKIAIERAKNYGIPAKKLNFVKNVVDLTLILDEKSRNPKEFLNIIFVGRLTQLKRPEIFVALANHLKYSLATQTLRFQVIGDGPLLDGLKQCVRKLHLSEDEITFYGDRQDVGNFYQTADLLVLTSSYEGTPNVVLEAMSFGVPVIATRVGGIPEIVTRESGILVDAADTMGLFDAARKLIENEDLRGRLGAAGKKYVAENHSLDYLQKRLIEIYNNVLIQ